VVGRAGAGRRADPDSLADVQVLGTWVAGRERFRQ
jgi:hypothetical protein